MASTTLTVGIAILVMTTTASAQASGASRPKLDQAHRIVFCGEPDREISLGYGEAVNAEIKWRLAPGARDAADALRQMRVAYCSPGAPN